MDNDERKDIKIQIQRENIRKLAKTGKKASKSKYNGKTYAIWRQKSTKSTSVKTPRKNIGKVDVKTAKKMFCGGVKDHCFYVNLRNICRLPKKHPKPR